MHVDVGSGALRAGEIGGIVVAVLVVIFVAVMTVVVVLVVTRKKGKSIFCRNTVWCCINAHLSATLK